MRNIKIVLFLVLMCSTLLAYADVPGIGNEGVIQKVIDEYKDQVDNIGSKLVNYGTNVFFTLAIISLVWTYGLLILKQADIGEFFLETIKFSIPLGFWYWLLRNGIGIATDIIKSLKFIASDSAGFGKVDLSPSGLIDVGFYIVTKSLERITVTEPVDSFVMITLALLILGALLYVVKEMLLLMVASWIIIYGGVFLLGFGGGRWTSDIAVSYLKTVLSIGMQLFGLIIVVGIGKGLIDHFAAGMDVGEEWPWGQTLAILVSAYLLAGMAAAVPKILGNIVGHTGVSGYGSLGFGAGGVSSMMAAGATAIAAMTVAANALAEAAKSVAANALGTADMAHAAFTSGRGGSEGGSVNAAHDAVASSTESLARTTNPAKALAAGMAAVAGNKVDAFKESMNARIGQTLPGQVANEIRNAGSGSGSGSNSNTASSSNSFSAGNAKKG